jgi:putative acetyltransferase
MKITLESPNQPDVIALINALDAYQKPLYPAESHHGLDLGSLCDPNVLFAVARDTNGQAIACGAIVLEREYGELKRMFTLPSFRGRGIAHKLLSLLEFEATVQGCRNFVLETGYLQPEAIALYESCGYTRRGPFGSYLNDPNSVFMAKSMPQHVL